MLSLPASFLPDKSTPPRRRDYRLPAVVAMFIGIVVLGWVVAWVPGRSVIAERVSGNPAKSRTSDFSTLQVPSGAEARQAASEELVVMEPKVDTSKIAEVAARDLLKDVVKTLRAKRYDAALNQLNQSREQIQKYPESFLLIGRALEGKKDYTTARDFYNAALDRDPMLSEAYWGMATTSEALGDLETALGGMRSFLHTVSDPDPFRLKIAQARSAIWEWEAKLGRGPWGPTKGIIPGLTPNQAAKNDRGVGIMVPIPGTEKEDGSVRFEVKNQDRFEIFEKK